VDPGLHLKEVAVLLEAAAALAKVMEAAHLPASQANRHMEVFTLISPLTEEARPTNLSMEHRQAGLHQVSQSISLLEVTPGFHTARTKLEAVNHQTLHLLVTFLPYPAPRLVLHVLQVTTKGPLIRVDLHPHLYQ